MSDPPAVSIEEPHTGSQEMNDPAEVTSRRVTAVVRDTCLWQFDDPAVVLDAQRQIVVFEVQFVPVITGLYNAFFPKHNGHVVHRIA